MGRVAIRLPNWLGDVIMATPFIREVRDFFKSEELFLVGKEKYREILDKRFYDEYITLKSIWNTAKDIKNLAIDHFFILPNSFGSSLLAFLSGAKRRIGYGKEGRHLLLTDPVPPPKKIINMPMYYLNLLSYYLSRDISPFKGLFLKDPEESDILERLGLREKSYAVIIPGASFGPSKMWPASYFKKLSELILSYYSIRIVVAPGPGEEGIACEIASANKDILSIVLNLKDLSCLIKNALFLVSNDTGPRHMGEVFGVPTFVLMGPTDPSYTNYPSKNTTIIRKKTPCSPCHKKICPRDLECLKKIYPEEVFQEIRSKVH